MEPGVFVPAITHMRTPDERRDQRRSWERPDAAFFASGACHVLAFRFLHHHPSDGFDAVLIHPVDGLPGSHVYVTDGVWAFDFNGWSPEEVLLAESAAECRRRWPSWDFERIEVGDDLDEFCRRWHHRLPGEFAFDVIERADRFLDRGPAVAPAFHRPR